MAASAGLSASKKGDAIPIQHIVVNLACNSMEVMSGAQNSPRNLTIHTFCNRRDTVAVEVLGTGPGIAENVLPKSFDPSFTTKAAGMDLSVCRSIVDQHGGKIYVANRNRGGAAFHVALAVAEQETAAA